MAKTVYLKKADRAVRIAKDIIASLKDTNVKPGYYIHGKIKLKGTDLQKNLTPIKKNCQVCALGACLLSHIKFYDNFKGYDYEDNSIILNRPSIIEELLEHFDQRDLNLIEIAFELTDSIPDLKDFDGYKGRESRSIAMEFGRQYKTPKARIKAIMLNVIKNKGHFIP